jgi:hypothetical protein
VSKVRTAPGHEETGCANANFRSDRRYLKGCWIGDVAKGGCSRECCPYPDSEASLHNRDHSPTEHRDRTTPFLPGRTSLYYNSCQSTYRPKFICSRKSCRRGVKPVYAPDRLQYEVSKWGDWKVRPRAELNPEFKETCKNSFLRSGARVERDPERAEIRKLWNVFLANDGQEEEMAAEDIDVLRRYDPELWWVDVVRLPRCYDEVGVNMKRCPGCGGDVMRVGGQFRIPGKRDEKGWRVIEEWIERGVDLVAEFEACLSVEEHEEMVDEVLRVAGNKEAREGWDVEKRRRMMALGLSPLPKS